MCQVEKKTGKSGKSTKKKETFLNSKIDTSRVPKNFPDLECTHAEGARVGCCKNAT